VTPSPARSPSVRSRLRFAAAVAAAGVVYFALACLIYRPAAPLDASRLPGCACGDQEQQTWFLAWVSYALTHGNNPFVTTSLHAPTGANLAIDTSMPLLGLLGMPVTLLAGPVATFNVLLRLGLAASGASMFGVLRRYVSWWPAAFGGGLMFAFSPYLADQAIRHLFLSFVPLLPLLIPLTDDWLVSRRRTPFRSGLLVGLVAGLQYLISAEIVLTSAIMAVIGLTYLALRYRSAVAERLGALVRGVAAAVPVFLLIAGYAIFMLLAGPDRPRGPVHSLSGLAPYHGDLLSPLYPTTHQLFAPAALASAGNHLPAGLTIEDGFYLGFPLLVLLGYLVIRCRRVPLVGVAAVIGAGAFILGLGPRLTVDGATLGVPLPFAVFLHLPVVQNLEAARFSLFIQLAAAIILAVGLDRVRAGGWLPSAALTATGEPGSHEALTPVASAVLGDAAALGRGPREARGPGDAPAPGRAPGRGGGPGRHIPGWVRPVVVAMVGLAAILPLVPRLPITMDPVNTPGFFTGGAVRAVPQGVVALTLPFDVAPQNDPMMWQLASGMRFRILGGDAFVPLPNGLSTWHPVPAGPPVLQDILTAGRYPSSPPPPVTAQAVLALRALIARLHIAVVLVDRSAHNGGALDLLVRYALRSPPLTRGRMDVWLNAQRDLRRHPGAANVG
jgi:hypothetical protein